MIIGSGNIASVLNDRSGVLFFAAGVSNSQCEDQREYYRDRLRIFEYHDTGHMFVYFSTISVFTRMSLYTSHKAECERIITEHVKNYCIIRLGNLDWDTNPNTFINYLRNKIAKGEPYEIRDEWKFMISKEQLLFVTDNLPLTGKHEISVFGEMKKVKDCL